MKLEQKFCFGQFRVDNHLINFIVAVFMACMYSLYIASNLCRLDRSTGKAVNYTGCIKKGNRSCF